MGGHYVYYVSITTMYRIECDLENTCSYTKHIYTKDQVTITELQLQKLGTWCSN